METRDHIWKQGIIFRNKGLYSESRDHSWKQVYIRKQRIIFLLTSTVLSVISAMKTDHKVAWEYPGTLLWLPKPMAQFRSVMGISNQN